MCKLCIYAWLQCVLQAVNHYSCADCRALITTLLRCDSHGFVSLPRIRCRFVASSSATSRDFSHVFRVFFLTVFTFTFVFFLSSVSLSLCLCLLCQSASNIRCESCWYWSVISTSLKLTCTNVSSTGHVYIPLLLFIKSTMWINGQ